MPWWLGFRRALGVRSRRVAMVFFMLQQMILNVAMGFFCCCNRCFWDVAVALLEMLHYVSVASISYCSSCSMLLQVFLFQALFHMLHTSVAIICFKCFSSFTLLLQQFVRCCCNNIFILFQLLHPNVAVVVPCCCNNMFMVFQLLHPNVIAVAPCCCNIYVSWCFSRFSLMLQ